jgi:hypothetical protein
MVQFNRYIIVLYNCQLEVKMYIPTRDNIKYIAAFNYLCLLLTLPLIVIDFVKYLLLDKTQYALDLFTCSAVVLSIIIIFEILLVINYNKDYNVEVKFLVVWLFYLTTAIFNIYHAFMGCLLVWYGVQSAMMYSIMCIGIVNIAVLLLCIFIIMRSTTYLSCNILLPCCVADTCYYDFNVCKCGEYERYVKANNTFYY